MRPLRRQPTALLALALPTATSALVPASSLRRIRSSASINCRTVDVGRVDAGGGGSAGVHGRRTTTSLSLALDPTDLPAAAQHAHHLLHHHSHGDDLSSALDFLSSLTLAKASAVASGQSLAPLSETMQSTPATVEVIPELPSMPGGAPRAGIPFLSETFRDLYGAGMKSAPFPPSMPPTSAQVGPAVGADGTIVVPARGLDLIGRYADLLDRLPLAAATYALIDFFLINAEEDLSIAELIEDDDEALEAIWEVENRVVTQRAVGAAAVAIATIAWSSLSYHPVPLGEL
ncbi:hypothetical protein ACHAWF_002186 [Thalassiosira exigua]